MNIKIVKNVKGFEGYHIKDDLLVEIEHIPSELDNLDKLKLYLLNLSTSEKIEIASEYDVYSICTLKNISVNKDYIYFTTCTDVISTKSCINICKYSVDTQELQIIYSFEDDLSLYNISKEVKIFIINEFHILIQNAYLRHNLTETYGGFFDYELYLYSYNDDIKTIIIDENLVNNGIDDIISLNEKMCVIKTGFSLLTDRRYEILSQEEVSVEGISFVNTGQLVSDILLSQKNIVLDTIDQSFYTSTIPYCKKAGDFLVYSKVNNDTHEEEITFYNYVTKSAKTCVNQNVLEVSSLAKTLVIKDIPYIMLLNDKGTSFYNLDTNEIDIQYDSDYKFDCNLGDIIIVSSSNTSLFGHKEKKYVSVYTYPKNDNLHTEKGEFISAYRTAEDNLYLIVE